LLNRLQDPKVEVDELQELIKTDVSLSYKILRYINSPGFNLDVEVGSIKQALLLLGLKTLKHWMTLIVLSGLSDKSADIIQKALIRAKMCELIADVINEKNREDYFLVGMFSMLDVMMDQEMTFILKSIPISQGLKDTLISRKGKEGKVLKLVIDYEHGNWLAMKSGSIQSVSLCKAYLLAVNWAEQTMSGLSK
jgi:EAL and modified HD-GYP domain-containing signal transduction protein